MGYGGGNNGGKNNGTESIQAKVGQNHLQGKQNAGDGCVEDGRQSGAGTGGHQNFQPFRRHTEELADSGTDGRTNLDDRPLFACRPTGADGGSRRYGGDDAYPGADIAPPIGDGFDYRRNTVPFDLSGKIVNNQTDRQAAHSRKQRPDPGAQVGTDHHSLESNEKQMVNQVNQ